MPTRAAASAVVILATWAIWVAAISFASIMPRCDRDPTGPGGIEPSIAIDNDLSRRKAATFGGAAADGDYAEGRPSGGSFERSSTPGLLCGVP